MININETKLREEYARQVLLSVYPEKYLAASIVDRPDIQNKIESIGVEVTGTMKQRLRYGLAQFSSLYGKPISSITTKKKRQLDKHKVKVKANEQGYIKFIIPAAVWGSGNDIKEAYKNKLIKLNSGKFSIFEENNLFLFAEFEEEKEVQELINFVKETKVTKYKFEYIFLYTFNELYSITTKNFTYDLLEITEDQKKVFKEAAIKAANVNLI
ncbi:hypothetical protein HNQ44_001354 [Planomicrobium koreense]|uniref:Uncharacterized protein n=1 Tax=Planococcus koreensis TaxID=112331 RepID=A0A7W8CTY9_9BACL|nr:hypothetical protein [Planococcus koreensis]MBB5179930.1 hypothetical protein [Planococcus koreensis]